MEKLYQPDFSSIFGAIYANAFIYGQIDSLFWLIFNDFKPSNLLVNLINLQNSDRTKCFYYRKISIEDEKIELHCSNIKYGLIQAMDLHRSFGISNEDVMKVVRKEPELFKGTLSFDLNEK
ncbi:MAG: hypothetical protein ACFE8G_11420 [Candidatus Hermodarchaeota archaeon]